jgi:uncharacterized membrane protein
MHIFLAGSLSEDVMTNALCMLLVALILRSALSREDGFDLREGLGILAVGILVSLSKHIFFLLAALALLIPSGRFGGIKRKIAYLGGLAAAGLAANALWAGLVSDIVMTVPWAAPARQMKFLLANPLQYVNVLVATLSTLGQGYVWSFVGVLGWIDTWLPMWIYPSYIAAMLGLAALDRGNGRSITFAERMVVAGTGTVIFFIILTVLYIVYTAPMDALIQGGQGRYFIPLAMPVLLVLYNRRFNVEERVISIVTMIFCTVVLVVTCHTLIERYYG